MLLVGKRPTVLVSVAILVATTLLLLADATGSTPARWYAALAAFVVVAVALVVASSPAPRLGLGVAVSVNVMSVLLFLLALLTATGLWPSPGELNWNEPVWGVAGAVVAALAVIGTTVVVVRMRRNGLSGRAATALALVFLVLAVLGTYMLAASVSFTVLVEGHLVPG